MFLNKRLAHTLAAQMGLEHVKLGPGSMMHEHKEHRRHTHRVPECVQELGSELDTRFTRARAGLEPGGPNSGCAQLSQAPFVRIIARDSEDCSAEGLPVFRVEGSAQINVWYQA